VASPIARPPLAVEPFTLSLDFGVVVPMPTFCAELRDVSRVVERMPAASGANLGVIMAVGF
jgi:hypothetical protein